MRYFILVFAVCLVACRQQSKFLSTVTTQKEPIYLHYLCVNNDTSDYSLLELSPDSTFALNGFAKGQNRAHYSGKYHLKNNILILYKIQMSGWVRDTDYYFVAEPIVRSKIKSNSVTLASPKEPMLLVIPSIEYSGLEDVGLSSGIVPSQNYTFYEIDCLPKPFFEVVNEYYPFYHLIHQHCFDTLPRP